MRLLMTAPATSPTKVTIPATPGGGSPVKALFDAYARAGSILEKPVLPMGDTVNSQPGGPTGKFLTGLEAVAGERRVVTGESGQGSGEQGKDAEQARRRGHDGLLPEG